MNRFCLFVVALAFSVSPTMAGEQNSLVIKDTAIFDSTAGKMLPHRTILIEGSRIVAVGAPEQPVSIPDNAQVIDGAGKYVIPGFIDAHVHLVHLADRTHVTGDQFLPLFLAAGVTSVRSAGDAIVAETSVANFAKSHPEFCPRVFTASPLIDRDPPLHRDVGYPLTKVEQVAPFVNDMAQWKVTTLKIYVGTPREIGREVIKQGHQLGIKVTGHLGRYTAQDAAVDGIDCLEHIWSVFNYGIPPDVVKQANHRSHLDLHNPKCQDLITLLANRQVRVDPTLVVFRNMIYLCDLESVHKQPELVHVPKTMLNYWDGYRRGRNLQPETRDVRQREIQKYQELTGLLHQHGVPLLVGTDTPEPYVVPGFSMHQELEMLVESGLTPADALRCATKNNAEIIGQADRLGRIDAGYQADLVILTADPTKEIRNSRKIETVIRSGIVAHPTELLHLVPTERSDRH